MKSLEFTRQLLADASDRCGVSTTRDFNTIASRVEHEGMSFLTITLPRLCSDLQKGLADSRLASDAWAGFQRRRGLPTFLSGFLRLVFDTDGTLRHVPSVAAILELRQILLAFSKIELPCSDARIATAFAQYTGTEGEVRETDRSLSNERITDFTRFALVGFGGVFSSVDTRVAKLDLLPRHGPGSTAEHLTANSRWVLSEWPARLDLVFPVDRYLVPSARYAFEAAQATSFLSPGSERPVRVITVPKTMKTPRVIAVEPAAMQFAQQALFRAITDAIEDDPIAGIISYLSSDPSRVLARQGSIDGSVATLDLSEASDRVSNQLVRSMTKPFTHLFDALQASRSRRADVPGIGVLRLAKFASMGSATCFPIETIVFTVIVAMALARSRDVPPASIFRWMQGRVRIYGDDIIVPVEYAHDVIEELEAFGLRVNRNKSFLTGNFREACGFDAFAGHDVTVARVRRPFARSRRDASELVSQVALRNDLFDRGYVRTVAWLDREIERLIPFPLVSRTSSVLGRFTHDSSFGVERMCPELQVPLVKGAVVRHKFPADMLEGYGALNKWFTLKGREPLSRDHLERAGRPYASRINVGWTRPD